MEEKYAVYIVIVEDTEEAFLTLSQLTVDGPEALAEDQTYEEASKTVQRTCPSFI